jgi:hypothetical protein
MSTTITIQNSVNFCKPFLKMQPLDITGFEPEVTAANIVLQTILGPPFRWPWNRSSLEFATQVTVPPTTDYVVSAPSFGFLEEQWLVDSSTPPKTTQLTGNVSLAVDNSVSRPTNLAAQFDDNQGNITFRVQNAPNGVYTVVVNYQRKPSLISGPAQTWGVVPDNFGYIYHLGFLTMMSLVVNDPRFQIFEKWFISRLLGAQDGLTDQQRDIFLSNWMASARSVQRGQGATQAGNAGRAQ